jgi:hypothetical protein
MSLPGDRVCIEEIQHLCSWSFDGLGIVHGVPPATSLLPVYKKTGSIISGRS